ncbi:hypothetical protein [Cyprinid herpesvirus 2]|uniref:Uncharacterized protein n=1 Tax=Cyprinid herpesvirus 2 TaxID=317878 RepID=A0A0E3T4Q2_CYHV2|nr:hypothetical protein [Cyprinid herpesvirus 2]
MSRAALVVTVDSDRDVAMDSDEEPGYLRITNPAVAEQSHLNWIERFNEHVLSHVPVGTDSTSAVFFKTPIERLLPNDLPKYPQLSVDWQSMFPSHVLPVLKNVNDVYGRLTGLSAHNFFILQHHAINMAWPLVETTEQKLVLLWMCCHLMCRVDDFEDTSMASVDKMVLLIACLLSPTCAPVAMYLDSRTRLKIGVVNSTWPVIEDIMWMVNNPDWPGFFHVFEDLRDDTSMSDVFEMASNYRRRLSVIYLDEACGTENRSTAFDLDFTKLRLAAASLTNATPYVQINLKVTSSKNRHDRIKWRRRLGCFLNSRKEAMYVLLTTGVLKHPRVEHIHLLFNEALEIAEAECAAEGKHMLVL